ncbi:hypothetical protein ACHQM5_027692 [Ranunculus cassubicifolius]
MVLGWGIIEEGYRKGPWTGEEDKLLTAYIDSHGEGRWTSVSKYAGLKRNAKSCRLRWVNYLRPDLKKGSITPYEETIILEQHAKWGNRWSTIARSLPGRTDNEIKNYWRTHFKKDRITPSYFKKSKRQYSIAQQSRQNQQEEEEIQNKLIMFLLNERNIGLPFAGDADRETVATYSNMLEQQCLAPSLSHSNYFMPEFSNQGILWDEQWSLEGINLNLNMDDPQARSRIFV